MLLQRNQQASYGMQAGLCDSQRRAKRLAATMRMRRKRNGVTMRSPRLREPTTTTSRFLGQLGAKTMWKRLLLILLLTSPARWLYAADFTDLWWNPAESGWGVTLTENAPFLFATFFIYGSDGKPTWYTGQMNGDSNGNFTGLLYASIGPYFGAAAFDPTQVSTSAVGNVSFQTTTADQGTITYNVGPVRVTKQVQRQTLTHTYIGG